MLTLRRGALPGSLLVLLLTCRTAFPQDAPVTVSLPDVSEVMSARETATLPLAFTYEAQTRFDSAPVDPGYRWQGRIATNGRALLETQTYEVDVDPSPHSAAFRDAVEVRYFDGTRSLVVKRAASDEGGWLGSVQSNLPGTGRMNLLRFGLLLDLTVPTLVSRVVRQSTSRRAALPPGSPPSAIYVIADLGEPKVASIEQPVGLLLDGSRGYFPVRIVMYAAHPLPVGAPEEFLKGTDALSTWCTYVAEELLEVSAGVFVPVRGTLRAGTTTVQLSVRGPVVLGDVALAELRLPTEVKRATVRDLDTNESAIVGTAVAEPDMQAIEKIADQITQKLPSGDVALRVQPRQGASFWAWVSAASAGLALGVLWVLRARGRSA